MRNSFTFVLILGLVNLFSDTTYEGASSINGPFLASLGANAAAIGIISGLGEFLGYSLRLPAGYISDKTGRYWIITFIGYAVNLLAVPALAFVNSWQTAALWVIAERVGRAIRKPTVEAMLSYTTSRYGSGWVYGLNTALDQIGATAGPLLVALILYWNGSFHSAYFFLLIPALLALATLALASAFFPNPEKLEETPSARLQDFTTPYWLYMAGGTCLAAGLLSFELISYHFAKTKVVSEHWIPLFFSIAMATDAIASLLFGRLYDRIGLPVVVAAILISALFAPFVFLGSFYPALFGILLWGVGFGAQDTLLKALIADVLPKGKRNLAFGLFYVGYGFGWLFGSSVAGLLYQQSIYLLAAFCVLLSLLSLPFFIKGYQKQTG